jgi:hypothetical protein
MTMISLSDKIAGDVDSEKIELKLRRTNFLTRWQCTICGGHIEKEGFLVEAESGHGTIRACWLCLRGDNPDGKGHSIDQRLTYHAAQLDAEAKRIRDHIGRLKVPTYREWEAEVKRLS